jgi:Ni,Fe-hydrogenase I large subunit
MPTITTIDPVTRLEGHLKIVVTVETKNGVQQVVDANPNYSRKVLKKA